MNKTSLKELGALVTSGKLKVGTVCDPAPLVHAKTLADMLADFAGKFHDSHLSDEQVQRVQDIIQDAYELGKKHGTREAALALTTIGEVNDKRAAHLLPACVAAIMEQSGITTMNLDLVAVATVFSRCTIDSSMGAAEGLSIVQYRLGHKADGVKS